MTSVVQAVAVDRFVEPNVLQGTSGDASEATADLTGPKQTPPYIHPSSIYHQFISSINSSIHPSSILSIQ